MLSLTCSFLTQSSLTFSFLTMSCLTCLLLTHTSLTCSFLTKSSLKRVDMCVCHPCMLPCTSQHAHTRTHLNTHTHTCTHLNTHTVLIVALPPSMPTTPRTSRMTGVVVPTPKDLWRRSCLCRCVCITSQTTSNLKATEPEVKRQFLYLTDMRVDGATRGSCFWWLTTVGRFAWPLTPPHGRR